MPFKRLIAIDWSGAGEDTDRVALRIAQWTPNGAVLVAPPSRRRARSWTRNEALDFLASELQPDRPRTVVAFDFAFGLPWKSDTEIFRANGWRPMLDALDELYSDHRTARATAVAINRLSQNENAGPYRFNENRTEFGFYLRSGVPYYRTVELVMPQAISVWYLGAGAAVGFHTITGLAALAKLMRLRDRGLVSFSVWPQEVTKKPLAGHILVEGYPAALPRLQDFGPCKDEHERDAWRMLDWMRKKNDAGHLGDALLLPENAIGRVSRDGLQRVKFEGWILGVA